MPNWRKLLGIPSNLSQGFYRCTPERTVCEREEDSGLVIRYDVVLVNVLKVDGLDPSAPEFASLSKYIREGHYCGYAMFPCCPVTQPERVEHHVITHGGITFDKEYPGGAYRFGFDCGHYNDEDRPELRNLDYLEELCRSMGREIWAYAQIEHALLYSISWEERDSAHRILNNVRSAGDKEETKVLANIKK